MLVIAVVILILGLLDLLNPVRGTFQYVTAPIQFGLRRSAISVKNYAQLFYSLNEIRKQNLSLLNDNMELKAIIVDLKKAEEENTALRAQLNLSNKDFFDKELLLAAVMGNINDLSGNSIIIDKGSRHGVEVGDNAIVANFLVGIITDVTSERSIAELVVSPDVSMTVKNISILSQTEGLARGELGTSITVSRILPSDVVSEKDIFVTTGKDGKFLPGLSVGEVIHVSEESADPLKNVVLKPMVDFSRLERVFIVMSK